MIRISHLLLIVISFSLISCHNQNIQQVTKAFSKIKIKIKIELPLEKQIDSINKAHKKIKSIKNTLINKTAKTYTNFFVPYPTTKYHYDISNASFSQNTYTLLNIYDNKLIKRPKTTALQKIKQKYDNVGKLKVNDSTIKFRIHKGALELKLTSIL